MDAWERRELQDQALDAARSGDHARALALVDRLAESEPELPGLSCFRSQLLLELDEPQAALAEAQKAVDNDPLSVPSYLAQAHAACRLNRLPEAQLAFENAIRLSDREPEILCDFARFMACHRGPRLGEEASRRALLAAPNSATAWASLGLAQFRQHRRQDAEASLARSLKLDPACSFAQATMVLVLQQKGDDARAVALSEVLADTPGTEAFVEGVRRESNRRHAMRKLYAREDVVEALARRERRLRGWQPLWWGLLLLAVLCPIGYYVLDWMGVSMASLGLGLAFWRLGASGR